MTASVDAIPRACNFAADILSRNLDAGRGNKAAYIEHRAAILMPISPPAPKNSATRHTKLARGERACWAVEDVKV